ncbi:hypothetical protein [Massilia aquatica]|uniref:hypothetical protein n=1 Tax=Massilia aquatica TaxID=2609000 RepID=UPI0016526360|nr:hypothetical protein [Massilia aquatica]
MFFPTHDLAAPRLVAAIRQACNVPKIICTVGHIDVRWSENNMVLRESTSDADQNCGGSINLPSYATLVGINDAQGRPVRMTGTSLFSPAD